jgi:hypothetical protein
MTENELLKGLGLIGNGQIPSLDDWREMAYTGSFNSNKVQVPGLDKAGSNTENKLSNTV